MRFQTKRNFSPEWRRATAVAGTFYTNDPQKLTSQLRTFCEEKAAPSRQAYTALMVPHAGYIYSGAIAGSAYSTTLVPPTVVVLCPNHTGMGKKISVWAKGCWETPLGEIPIDEALSDCLLKESSEASSDQEAHLYEHSGEVQLPFLKFLRTDVKVVMVTLGRLSLETVKAFGKALAATVSQRPAGEVLLIASTDMNHFESAEVAKSKDKNALSAVEALSGEKLYETVVQNDISMCGFIPTACTLEASRRLGANRAKIVRYGNSGDVTHDYTSVVAYAAATIAP